MNEPIAYFNGNFLPESQILISPMDRGFRMGDGIYESERTFAGKIFRLSDHIDRLYNSLTYVRIDPKLTKAEMAEICEEVVSQNEPFRQQIGDWIVRQQITRGLWSSSPTGSAEPTVYVSVHPNDFGSYARQYEIGGQVIFPRVRAYSSDALEPKAKHTSRMNFVLAGLEASDIDPSAYPVLLDQEGNIAEGTSFNFYIVKNGVIKTPSDRSALQGVSRIVVAELASQMGIPLVEEDLQLYDAYTADEAFITASSYCILPISRLDGRPIQGEVPGSIVKQLLAAWSERVNLDIVGQALNQSGLNQFGTP